MGVVFGLAWPSTMDIAPQKLGFTRTTPVARRIGR